MVRTLPVSLVLLLAACGERSTLLVELQHPTGLDPVAVQGTLKVAVLGADGAVLDEQQLGTDQLASRRRLFDALGLEEGETYRLRLELALAATESACGAGGRAVGLSPPFEYGPDLERVPTYLDCADRASATGNPAVSRIYHTATLAPAAGSIHDEVLLVAGAKPSTDIENPDSAELLDSIERYDPATGQFTPVAGKLARPRMLHQAVAVGGDVVVSGGLDKVTVVSKTSLVSVKNVERVREGRVAALTEMQTARSIHGAAVVGDTLVLVGGIGSSLVSFVKEAELYDPTAQAAPRVVPLAIPRFSMAAVALGDGRRVLLAGGMRVEAVDVPDELLCLSGSCPCGAPPCSQPLTRGFGVGQGRYGLTGTRVDCPGQAGGGAIYLVGGTYKDSASQVEQYFDDIHCFDLQNTTATERVGQLERPRSGHTTTLVRGPGGKQRLLVAGGSGTNAKGEGTIWNTAELIDVDCRCGPITSRREVALQSQRALHSATLLADGTVLLAGGIFVGGAAAERFNPDF